MLLTTLGALWLETLVLKPSSYLLPGSRARSAQQLGKTPCLMHDPIIYLYLYLNMLVEISIRSRGRCKGAKLEGYVVL